MSCLLTAGRLNPCSDTQGGLKYVEFADFDTLGDITYDITDTDVVTAFAGTPTWFKYELNSTANNFVENINSDGDAGTTYYEQVLTLSLKKLDQVSHKELKLVTYGRPHVRITDRNDNVFIMGLLEGTKVTAGSAGTGGAMADFNGYSLTLTGNEKTPANFASGSATT
jgi:hypothetical protein